MRCLRERLLERVIRSNKTILHFPFPASQPCSEEGKLAAYGASKAALSYFAKAINRQEAANGIRINILSPGVIVTPIITPFINVQKTGKTDIDETL